MRSLMLSTIGENQWNVEVNPVPASISDRELELNICKTLTLIEHEVQPNDLQRLLLLNVENINAKSLLAGKNLRNKSEDLRQLRFSGKLFLSESMCHENYKYRQLKYPGKIQSTWFWNNTINAKLSERSNPVNIFHITDNKKLFVIDNLDDFISKKCSDLLLRCVFRYMFFYLGFLSRPFTIHWTAKEGGGHFFNSSLPLPPASQTLRH